MKKPKRLMLYISLICLTFFIGGCGTMNKEDSKDKEIKNNFQKTLNLYPTKNLDD
ncbi:tandem-type lipoprotein, partial [Staphylococcus warneri]